MSESEKLWPTPQAFDANDVPNGNQEERRKKGGCKNLCQETAVWFTPTTGQQHQEITQGMIDHHLRTGEGNLMEMAGAFMAEMSRSRSSARVSRASRFQLLASVRELLTSVTSGPKSPASFARFAPDGSWVRTSEDCSLFPMDEFSVPFLETWPTWGIALDGVAMALTKPLEQPIGEIGCSSLDTWATPQGLGEGRGLESAEHYKKKAENRIARGLQPFAPMIHVQAENWATEDFPQAQPTSTHGEPSSPPDQTSPPPSPVRRRLNWRFVEWLMGFPEGWL